MPSVYQTTFGGNPVAPAIPTYLALNFSVNTILGWPLESNITAPAVAEWIDCTATAPALTLQLSDARQVSTGYTAIFNNVGANTFSVLDAQGNILTAPASGTAWVLVLSDNSTLQGTWRTIQLGAGVSAANAAALAGAGLKAITTTLNERILINAQNANYVMINGDRASCVEWTGGSGGTFTAPSPGVVGSDWFCYVKNSGTGVLTLNPTAGTIDGVANKTFNPGDSCILLSDGTNLFTLGFGQSVASIFSFVTIPVNPPGTGTIVLFGAQLNRVSYKFTGVLTGNVTIQVPAAIQQYWVDNETTGPFLLTFASAGGGSTVSVSQTNRAILYCDGTNVVLAQTAGAVTFANGSAASPSITFTNDSTTGLYLAGVHILGITVNGIQRAQVDAAGHVTVNAPDNNASAAVTMAGGLNGTVLSVQGNTTTAVHPHLLVQSQATQFAFFSIAANAGTPGTNDFALFQNGTTLDASVINRASGGLTLGTNGLSQIVLLPTAVTFPTVGTTASPANAFLDNAASNNLLRVVSSIRYKTDIEDLPEEVADRLMKVRPVLYRSTSEHDDPNRQWLGVIAEELHEILPELVIYTNGPSGDKIPDGVDYARLTVLMVSCVKRLRADLQQLKTQLSK